MNAHRTPCAGHGSRFVRVLPWLVMPLLLGIGRPAHPQDLTLKAEPGLSGYVKPGQWLPILVDLENAGDELDGSIAVKIGQSPQQISYQRPVRLATGARQRHILFVRDDRPLNAIPVTFRREQVEIRPHEIDAADRLVLAVSPDRSGLSFLPGVNLGLPGIPRPAGAGAPGQAARVYVAHTDAAGLFDSSLGYSSVDVVQLGNVSLRGLSAEQRNALKEWVQDGGTLIVTGGSDVSRLGDPLLREILPVENPVSQPVPSLSALLARWPSAAPAADAAAVIAAAQPRPDARVWVSQGNVPLVVSHGCGNGRVFFFAFDPDQAPVRAWSGQEAMWREILMLTTRETVLAQGASSGYSQPIQGGARLASAVTDVPSMDFPRARVVGLFFLAYILCLVPINYLVLRRFDRREYAWATVPAIVLVFCVIALGIGYGTRGGAIHLYRLEALEAAPGSPWASGTSYLGLFSPRRAGYALESPGTAGLTEGEPGSVSYLPHSGASEERSYTVVQADKTRLDDIRLNMWAMRVFSQPAHRDLGGALQASLQMDTSGDLTGEITNGTSVRLDGGELLLGRALYPLGPVRPGERVRLGTRVNRNLGSTAPAPHPDASSPERIRLSACSIVENALLQSGGTSHPVLLAWGPPTAGGVRVVGRRPTESAAAVYLFHLPPPSVKANPVGLPAGSLSLFGRFVGGPGDGTAATYPSGWPVQKEFTLPVADARIRQLTLRFAGGWRSAKRGKVAVLIHEPRTRRWVACADRGGIATVPDPQRFVDVDGQRILTRLEFGGTGYDYHVTRFDLSATLER